MFVMINKQKKLKTAPIKHHQKFCLSYMNINSIRKKLDSLLELKCGLAVFLQ